MLTVYVLSPLKQRASKGDAVVSGRDRCDGWQHNLLRQLFPQLARHSTFVCEVGIEQPDAQAPSTRCSEIARTLN